jgi:CHAT domain-containing protein/tetratricopeptide (TPR) repeat protein
VNLARDHLRFQEIAWLAEGPRRGYATPGQEAQLDEIRHHLSECPPCQGLVQMHEDLQRRMGQLDAAATARPAPDCPSETVWWGVAAGQLPDSQVTDLLEHSTHCDACGLLLRQAIQDFTEEVADQEIGCLTALPSAQQEWQQSLAKRLVAARTEGGQAGNLITVVSQWARSLSDRMAWHPRSAFRYAWAYATAAIVVLAAGVWFVQTRRQPSIDQLLASAYSERRPFELRIAGAAYGPVRQERSGERSAFAEPADLNRAEYLIQEQLAARPNDQAMLVASGKVELLTGHYDEAIRTFGRLLDAHPDSPPLLIDLATAYFQRAEALDRAIDYGQTIDLLGRVLAKTPDDPLALFNRAIALQKMYAYNEAIRDWEHYLRLDPKGNWANEARQRLGELREKMKARDRPAALLQSDPVAAASLLRARADGQSTSSASWPASFDEEYLDLAVRQWLASLYVSTGSSGRKAWRREQGVWDALAAAADVFRTRHKDPWLADLLRELPDDSAPLDALEPSVKALDLLSQAARANASGDPDSARPLAESAARLFHTVKSNAGDLRAREEIIYSLFRAAQIEDCLKVSGRQLIQTKLESYSWLMGQAILWHATCQSYAGNLDKAQRLSEQALELTKRTGYGEQHLRSVVWASGFLRSTERNWQDIRAGLQTFWSDLHSPVHGYEFYAELSVLAEDAQEWYLASVLHREALVMIERTPDRSYNAVAHHFLAVASMRVRDLPEAEAEFRIASQEFSKLPDSSTNRLYEATSKIDLAAVEVQQGRLDSAAARLEVVRPLLADISDSWTSFSFYQTLGQLHFKRGNVPEAERAFWNAVRVGEVHLWSLQSDTDRLAWERDAAPAYRALVEIYARKSDGAARAFELWEWYRASALRGPLSWSSARDLDLAKLETGPAPPFLSRIRATLPALKHETVISFAYLPSGVAAWAFDDRGVNFAWLTPSGEELAGHVRHFAQLCADPSSNIGALRQEGRSLYNWLFAPFEQYLEPSRLLIVEPDSILSNVPWSALVDPQGDYLGSKFAVVNSPGLGYWLNLRSPTAISPAQTALVVGMPTLASSVASRFAPLPDVDRETQSIASQFRHSRLLSGTKVTSLAIRQELPRSDVFHFAGHAVSGITESGLVLASPSDSDENANEPRLLSASDLEIATLQRLQLVVLSACATAETEKGFTAPDTLVRGFLRAGVPHVVASRWQVDSHTTERTMTEFYKHIFQGQPSTRALQQATSSLLTEPTTSHPYYWAAFAAYGR